MSDILVQRQVGAWNVHQASNGDTVITSNSTDRPLELTYPGTSFNVDDNRTPDDPTDDFIGVYGFEDGSSMNFNADGTWVTFNPHGDGGTIPESYLPSIFGSP
ncbi:MAG: hypothetical protein SFZ03_11255 [Candidatus Melainabacteria bacterium]|nr:hypothetical protein [Candidatus Melainabacteria bacterium]